MAHDQRRARAALGGASAAAVVLTLAGLVPSSGGSAVAARGTAKTAYPVAIGAAIDGRGTGSFTLRGGLFDSGTARVQRAVVDGRLQSTVTLSGSKGRIVLTATRRCARATGTWRALSGTGAYERVTGRGATSGGTCSRPFRRATVTYRGTLDLPPPSLAAAGAWGGTTAQGGALRFSVTPDGRSVVDLLVGGFRYQCLRSDGLRISGSDGGDTVHAGPFAIADDRTFSVKAGFRTIEGRFTASDASGTIAIRVNYPADAQGRTIACDATTTWSATTPAPSAKRALAGTYCGFAMAGGGVCVDVTADGRQVRNLRAEVHLTCGILARIPVKATIAYDVPMPLQSDLSFRQSFTQPFEGGTNGASISGRFDENGGLSGTVGLTQPTIVRDGARHVCRGNGGFTAKLQR